VPSFAQKSGGILRVHAIDSPPSLSMHEEVDAVPARATMGVFNNLVMFDQHVKQNSITSVVPDLATGWSWSEDGTELTFYTRLTDATAPSIETSFAIDVPIGFGRAGNLSENVPCEVPSLAGLPCTRSLSRRLCGYGFHPATRRVRVECDRHEAIRLSDNSDLKTPFFLIRMSA